MKEAEISQLTKKLSDEIETIVLTQGKPDRHVLGNGKLWFTTFEVMIKNKKMFALVAHPTAFRALGANKKNSGLLLIAHDRDFIIEELAKILISFEDMGLKAA